MNLLANETEISGHWTYDGQKMLGDKNCERIEYLTSSVLQQLAFSKAYGAWETLFRDPTDGRLWERVYPEGHLQGGGPPKLIVISPDEAERKYGPIFSC